MFEAAREMLASEPFDLFIADVRLRGYNGLHLVRQIRRDRPEMATMIMTGYDDTMMELESGRYGAAFVRKPIDPAAFLETVAKSLAETRRARRWQRKQIVGGFRVTANGQPAAVLDVSYGGLRLEMPQSGELPSRSAWTSPHSTCTSTWTRCGANLPPTAPRCFVAPRWRPTRRRRPRPGATSSIGCRRNSYQLLSSQFSASSFQLPSFTRSSSQLRVPNCPESRIPSPRESRSAERASGRAE